MPVKEVDAPQPIMSRMVKHCLLGRARARGGDRGTDMALLNRYGPDMALLKKAHGVDPALT